MTALPTLGGNNGQAWQVSNNGEVAGTAETATADPSCNVLELETEPVIWENGQPQQLPTVSGDLDGAVQDINDHEQAVGLTGNCVADFPNTIFMPSFGNAPAALGPPLSYRVLAALC